MSHSGPTLLSSLHRLQRTQPEPRAMTTELHTANTLTTHEHIGFELGWDYAHYHVTPPAP